LEPDPDYPRELQLMDMFSGNAKRYTDLSGAALALTITFIRDVLGVAKDKPVPFDGLMVTSWTLFLIAIGAGVFYQYLAIKFLEWKSGVVRHHRIWPEWLTHHPWPLYGLMLISFYGGAVFFTASAIRRMIGTRCG
jgi:hypothetical protein